MPKTCDCHKCKSFREQYPFEYLEVFGLYHSLSEYIYPRLEAFRDNTFSYPCGMSSDKWIEILNKMIFAFKTISDDDIRIEDNSKIEEGIKLFSKYYRDLWI